MKYKLLKDLPFAKAGEVFERVTYKSKDGLSDYDYLKISKREKDGEDETVFTIDCNYFLDNLDEWFGKIKADGIHWKPKKDDEYFWMNSYGETQPDVWDGDSIDIMRLALGMVYRTEEECKEAYERKLAEVRLQRTSTFEPDFENGNGGWVVFYSYADKELHSMRDSCTDSGELVRYETEEEAKRSIRENREDWLIYFGVKE
jgi:hypothetical protein